MPSSSFQKAARFEDLIVYVDHPSHPFLACKTCRIAVPLAAIPTHFSASKGHNYRAGDVKQLMDAWVELHLPSRPVSLATFTDLDSWPYPASPPYPPPLPFLPIHRGMHCMFQDPVTGTRCTAIKRRQQHIAEHCSAEHKWVNPVSRGNRPTDVNVRERPWETNIPCQHLRPTGIGGELFRVRVEEQQPQPVHQTQSNAAKGRTWEQLEAELDTLHAAGSTQQTLATPNTSGRYPIHMSAWLEKTGWPVYLEGQDLRAVARLLEPPTAAEHGLRALLQAFDELINQARQSILDEEVNIFALHRVNSFIPNRPYRKPLQTKLLESTYKRYQKTWHRLLTYVYRLAILRQGPDLHYILTAAQQLALHQISAATPPSQLRNAGSDRNTPACDSSPPPLFVSCNSSPPPLFPTGFRSKTFSSPSYVAKRSQARHRRSLIAEERETVEGGPLSPGSESDSEFHPSRSPSLIPSPASRSASEDAGLHNQFSAAIEEAFRTSPCPSTTAAAAATSRVLANTACVEWQELCLQLCIALLDHKLQNKVTDSIVVGFLAANGINRERTGFEEAATATSPLSALVKLAQLLIVQYALSRNKAGHSTHAADLIAELQDRFMTYGSNSPINLILNLRAYGAVIRDNTTSAGVIEWTDDGQEISYKGIQLTMDQLRGFFRDETRIAYDQLAELLLLPDCEDDTWAKHVPNPTLSSIQDDPNRNGAGESFLDDPANCNHLVQQHPKFLLSRIKDNHRLQKRFFADIDQLLWDPKAVQAYLQLTYSFLQRLLLLIHMTGGQPARATELVLLRWRNSPHGDIRNIFIENGQVVFVTAYHKNYAQSSTARIIQRYLPRELGRLLVWYLWMVIPFLHALHLLGREQGNFTAPHPCSYLWPASLMEAVQGKIVRKGLAADSTTDRSQMQPPEQHWTALQLGLAVKDILAKQLSRGLTVLTWRHMAVSISRKHLPQEFQFQRDYSLHEGDSVLDLQAAHSSNRAAISYARDRRAGPGFTALRSHEFRAISRSWHTFLGFGDAVPLPYNQSTIQQSQRTTTTQTREKRAREEVDAAELNMFLTRERMLRQKKRRKRQDNNNDIVDNWDF